MRLRFLWVGKTKDPLFSEIEERYLKRLERFIPTRRTWVPELKKLDARQKDTQLEREANRIEDKLPSRGYLVVLDQLGEELTSKGLASFVQGLANRSVPELTFLVGGHLGISRRIKNMADHRFALTRLTLPHELARIVLLEQVYRTFTIIKGFPYHR